MFQSIFDKKFFMIKETKKDYKSELFVMSKGHVSVNNNYYYHNIYCSVEYKVL